MMSNYTTFQRASSSTAQPPPQYRRAKVEQKLPIYASFFNKVVKKPLLFYKALYGYLLVLCFGLAMSSATAQQGVTLDYFRFYQETVNNSVVNIVLGDGTGQVTNFCGGTPQGNYEATFIAGNYLQDVTTIPLSQYAVVKRGKPFKFTFNGYKCVLSSSANVYIGSENEPTRLIGSYTALPTGTINETLTPIFNNGASKAWIVIEGNVDAVKPTRLVIPFVVEGFKTKEIPVLGTTTTPKTPYMVVHAPPGDKSTSSFTKTGRNCRSFEQTQTTDKSKTGDLAIKVGMKGTLGAILMIDYELSATFTTVNTSGNLKVTNTATETCTEVTNTFSTDGLYSNGNKTSDLFVGYGVDENYGIGEIYEINPTTCQVDLKTNLVLQPIESTVREFRLTEEGIRADMDAQQALIDNPASTNKQKANANAQKKVWQQVLDKNNANKNNLTQRLTGVNFSAGASGSTTTAEESTESSSLNVERYVEGSNAVSFITTFGASGAFGGATFNTAQRWGTTNGTTSGQKTEISYTLSDDDQGDQFQVDVYRDRQYGTPFFKLGNGSKTSCPYEGGYQLDQPNLTAVGATGNSMTVSTISPSSANFELRLCNNSNVARDYKLSFASSSNAGNAKISALGSDNFTLSNSINVPANSCSPPIRVDVARRDNATSPISFPNLEFQLKSDCGDISSSFFATVNLSYVPPITLVSAGIQDQTICPNGTLAACLVTAAGGTGNYTYQWYVNTTNSTTGGTAIPNATAALFNPPTNVAGNKYYYCVVSCAEGNCASATSIVFHVLVNSCTAPVTVFSNGPQDQTICPGVAPQAYSVAAQGGTGNFSYQWYVNTTNSTTGGTAIPNANTTGFSPPNNVVGEKYYYCVVSCADGSCTSAISTVFHIIVSSNCGTPLSVSALNYSSLTVCNGQTIAPLRVTVTGGTGNYKYEWYSFTDNINDPNAFVNILIPDATAASYTPPSRIGKYFYQCAVSCVEGTCGRFGTNSAAITVNNCTSPITLSTPSVATQTLCLNATSTPITITATGGAGTLTYQWYANTTATNTGGTLVANATSSTFTPPTNVAGMLYYYCVVNCTGGGCTAVSSTVSQVTINIAPTGSVNSPSICAGGTATLNATGGTSYAWSTGATTPSVSVTPTTTTNYTVTITNANGCSGTTTATVTVNPLPVVTVNSPKTCSGVAATLTASGGTTYLWSTNETTPSVSVSPAGTATYSVKGTDAKGCSNTANATVTVNPKPTINVNSPTVCAGSTALLTATGGVTYTWMPGGSTGNTLTVNAPASATPNTYTVTGTDANGCTNTATSTVSLGTALVATVNNATICAGTSAILTATGGTNYTWSNNATTPSVTVSPTTTTNYTVTVTNGSGCSGIATATVTVNAAPTIGVNNATICAGTNATLTATGALTYLWSTSGSSNQITVNPTATTNYSVVGTDANGCKATGTGTVLVNALPAGGTITGGGVTVCATANTGQLKLTGFTGTIAAWESSPDGVIWATAPNSTTTSTYTFTNVNTATQFRARLVLGSCTAYSPVATVNVNLAPLGGVISGSHLVCPNRPFTLTLSGHVGQVLYWQQTKNGSKNWSNIPFTGTVYSSPGISSTVWFRAVVVNGSCSTPVYSVPIDGTDGTGFKVTGNCSLGSVVSNNINRPQTAIEKTATVDTDIETVNVNGQNNVNILRGINVYPNPASKEAWIEMTPFEGKNVTLTVSDMLGKTIQQEVLSQVSSAPHRLDIANLPTGLYLIKVQTQGEQVLIKKLQITK